MVCTSLSSSLLLFPFRDISPGEIDEIIEHFLSYSKRVNLCGLYRDLGSTHGCKWPHGSDHITVDSLDYGSAEALERAKRSTDLVLLWLGSSFRS